MDKAVIIHPNVKNTDVFVQCLNTSTKCFLYDTLDTTSIQNDIISFVTTNQSITRLGFVWDNTGCIFIPFFNYTPTIALTRKERAIERVKKEQNLYIPIDFIKAIIQANPNINKFDLISCSINDKYFIDKLNVIEQNLNIKFTYSTNITGNDTDWVQESNNDNIKTLYLTDNIANWHHTLTGAI